MDLVGLCQEGIRGGLHSSTQCNEVIRKWSTTQLNECTRSSEKEHQRTRTRFKIDNGSSGRVSEISLAGIVGPFVVPPIMQSEGFLKGLGFNSFICPSSRRIVIFGYKLT